MGTFNITPTYQERLHSIVKSQLDHNFKIAKQNPGPFQMIELNAIHFIAVRVTKIQQKELWEEASCTPAMI